MNDKVQRTLNGVNYALVGAHTHLVSDITDTIAMRARRATSTQSISANTATKVQYNVEDYDYGTVYDAVTNFRFVPPANQSVGVYRVIASAYLNNTSIGRLMLYKNGVEYQRLYECSSANIYYSGVTEVLLTTTDYLEIYIYCNTARTIAITNSFLNISSVF